jgi:hypothetical protein
MMNSFDELSYINSLEKKLSESLRPVRPDPSFIHTLKTKLSQRSIINIERPVTHPELIILGIGLLTGALIVWLMRRPKS